MFLKGFWAPANPAATTTTKSASAAVAKYRFTATEIQSKPPKENCKLTFEVWRKSATSDYQQIARLDGVVHSLGSKIVHVKPHGALYNVAARHENVARAIAEGVQRWNAGVILFGLAGSPMLDVWRGMGLTVWGEAFADRRYEPDGTLRSRRLPDALITDPAEAAAQAARFASEGNAQTVCVHGDTPGAVEILKACREALT